MLPTSNKNVINAYNNDQVSPVVKLHAAVQRMGIQIN